MLGAVIPVDRFILTGIVIVVAAALAALYRWTRFGLATRAASENEVAAMLSGLSPNRLSMTNTLLASPDRRRGRHPRGVDHPARPETLPLQIVPALAAALIAALHLVRHRVRAGIGIGILDSLLQYASAQSWFPQSGGVALPGVNELLVFVIIVVVHVPARRQRSPAAASWSSAACPRRRARGTWSRTALVLRRSSARSPLVVLPFDFREALINTLIGTVMALSLVVITGFVGQISVVQLALAGVAGFTISHLAVNAGIAFPSRRSLGIAVAAVIGLITAVSALRVRGVSLAVVTLAAAVAIAELRLRQHHLGRRPDRLAGARAEAASASTSARAPRSAASTATCPSPVFGWVVLICACCVCLLVGLVRRGTLGQRMLAVRSNERAAAAAAINPRNVKLFAFGISAVIAGVAGALYAYNFGSVSADRFDAFTALSLIAFAYAGGITLISGAVFAGLISTQALFPYALDKWFGLNGNWFLLFGGVILIVTLHPEPGGRGRRLLPADTQAPGGQRAEGPAAAVPARAEQPHRRRAELGKPRPPVLRVNGLSVAFGGVHALRDVDLEVARGRAGRPDRPQRRRQDDARSTPSPASSRFSGQRRARRARHRAGWPPYERARLGLGRTWQSTDLFDDLDVRENLTRGGRRTSIGAEARSSSARAGRHRLGGRGDAGPSCPGAAQARRRRTRAGRAGPRLLCLDEPAAGLDTRESAELGARLRELADQGQSTLLIDHDMGLVLSICDRVVVLEFGQVIAERPAGRRPPGPAGHRRLPRRRRGRHDHHPRRRAGGVSITSGVRLGVVTDPEPAAQAPDIREARRLFPATAIGPTSTPLRSASPAGGSRTPTTSSSTSGPPSAWTSPAANRPPTRHDRRWPG